MRYYIFLLLISIISLQSCEDELEQVPENSMTYENGMNTEQELDGAIRAMALLSRSTLIRSTYPALRGMFQDETAESLRKIIRLEHEFVPYLALGDDYRIVAEANLILESLEKINLPEKRNNLYKGSVLFYKALAYWHITRCYGDAVLVKDKPILDPVAKTRMNQIYVYIIDLLEKAKPLVPEYKDYEDSNGNIPKKYIVTKGAVNALLASSCLWQAGTKWFAPQEDKGIINETELIEKAEAACTEIIESNQYSLASSISEVCEKTLLGNSNEAILEFPYKDYIGEIGTGHIIPAGFLFVTYPVRNDVTAYDIEYNNMRIFSSTVKNMYEEKDQRRKEYFYKVDEPLNPDEMMLKEYAYPYKYRYAAYQSFAGTTYRMYKGLNIDLTVFRLTDVYMLRAEARAKLGKNSLAIEDLNKIRARAEASLYSPSEYNGDLLTAVFEECDKEFMFEHERYHRTIRYGESYVRKYLHGYHKIAPISDFTDGALWQEYMHAPLKNPLWRGNVYWSKKK